MASHLPMPQTMPAIRLLVLVTLVQVATVAGTLAGFSCTKTRSTGSSNNHRTLNVPAAMWDAATSQEDLNWANKLCCTYTWAVRQESGSSPSMTTYDGSVRIYSTPTSFRETAESVYSAICGMSMGSDDCASASQRCPARTYDAVGQLCRPKNSDGYSISTQVVTAAACRAKCEADAGKCGAFEYEFVAGDDRECELHEKTVVSVTESRAMGACLLSTSGGGDPMDDPPILGMYRCCWVVTGEGVPSAAAGLLQGPVLLPMLLLLLALSVLQLL